MKKLFLLVFALVLTACPNTDSDYEFDYETIITETPANLTGINSEYDDYNSALPYPAASWGLYFSSNRESSGNQFNIIHKNLDLSYHVKDDVLDVHTGYGGLSIFEDRLLTLIKTDYDELGPWSFWGPLEYSYFFYASNQDGDFDIKFVYNLKSDFGTYDALGILNGPLIFEPANSQSDDLYPCITDDQSQILFCSNRDGGNFNIYSLPLPSEEELHDFFLSGEPGVISLESVLSSDQNDKCPFIQDDLLVFASDREGGYGGFDLYYSLLKDGTWSAPVNFGPAINSEYDEYRPIAFSFDEIEHLMLFSSDRPGGLGGFDLYMVKLANEL